MELENQRRVKALAEQYGPENTVVLLGAAEGEAAGRAAAILELARAMKANGESAEKILKYTRLSPAEVEALMNS